MDTGGLLSMSHRIQNSPSFVFCVMLIYHTVCKQKTVGARIRYHWPSGRGNLATDSTNKVVKTLRPFHFTVSLEIQAGLVSLNHNHDHKTWDETVDQSIGVQYINLILLSINLMAPRERMLSLRSKGNGGLPEPNV